MRINKREKGIALIISYIVIAVLTVLSLALMAGTISESGLAKRFDYSTHAFWLAEAGVDKALRELNFGGVPWSGWTSAGNTKSLQVSWGQFGDFDITVTDPDTDYPKVVSTGMFPSRTAPDRVSRTVEVLAGRFRSAFTYAAFGVSSIDMTGTTLTDSYDSRLGLYNQNGNKNMNGDVGTNQDMTGVGGIHVYGDVTTGPNGVFNDQSKVSGTITHNNDEDFPMPVVPDSLAGLPTGGSIKIATTIPPGDYKFTSMNLAGSDIVTIIGPANIYFTGNTSMYTTGQSKVVISAASTGPVVIYADGDVTVAGLGLFNESMLPPNLTIYGTSTTSPQTIKVAGSGSLYGTFYAPKASIDLVGVGGGGDLFGAAVGNVVKTSGVAQIHYDEALQQVRLKLGKYIIQSWKDNPGPYQINP
ncbi:MAG: hypothetical protein ACM3IL_01900 [Deltaproteobacteria bacterium]